MRIKSILFLLVCFLLSGLTLQAIACPPPDCDDCETWNTETEMCESDCSTGQCCEDDGCVDDCSSGKCCDDGDCVSSCPTGDCCDDGDCASSCPSGKCCDDGDCVSSCPSGECCDDGDCASSCPTGECCDDGTCVSSCPTGECCDDGTCVSSCPTGKCCSSGTCVSSCPTGECCDDGDCVSVCPDCNDCVSGTCEPIEVDSVDSDKGGACVDCSITFTAITDPPGHEDEVSWSGGGDPSTGSEPSFTTSWGTIGKKTVTASLCDSSKSKDVYVAEPTNFQLVEWWDIGGGDLMFHCQWDSTSGNLAHLDGCEVGEIAHYPNGDPYIPSDPPFDNWKIPNPAPKWEPAHTGCFDDFHHKAGGFSQPYCNASFTGLQRYRYRDCTGSPIIDLTGTISIIREVFESSGLWWYSTTKDPGYAEAFFWP